MRCPTGLDAPARALWRRVVDDLTDREVLREVDAAAIERYVTAEMVARQALARIRVRERTEGDQAWRIRVTHGGWGVHPDARIYRESTRDAAAYARDLGLTPGSRRALPASDLDEFLIELQGGSRR